MRGHEEVLALRQRKVLNVLSAQAARLGLYLGGGTAVALHLGHRRSVDLDWFSEVPALEALLSLYRRHCGIEDIAHVLQGLVYFDDAERDRMPRMIWDVDWKTVKQAVRGWVKRLVS